MMIKRANTITLDFKSVKKKPTNYQLHVWIREKLDFSIDQLLCIQFDHLKNQVYIKLISKLLVEKNY